MVHCGRDASHPKMSRILSSHLDAIVACQVDGLDGEKEFETRSGRDAIRGIVAMTSRRGAQSKKVFSGSRGSGLRWELKSGMQRGIHIRIREGMGWDPPAGNDDGSLSHLARNNEVFQNYAVPYEVR